MKKMKNALLPSSMWLQKHQRSLLNRMYSNPDAFAHIPKERKVKTLQEWVALADLLAREHGGILPGSGWMQKNDYIALDAAIRRDPDAFTHIARQRLRKVPGHTSHKSPEEWIPIAKHLEKTYGAVPGSGWLQDNNWAGLDRVMRNNPKLFKGIKRQEKLFKTPEEWVSIAKQLAKKHNGLPGWTWLRKNKLDGLTGAMKNHPQLFKGIKRQESTRKSCEEWVPVAKQLATEHNGLPGGGWLRKSGYMGLYLAMRRHPKLFKGIKRQEKLLKTPQEWVSIAKQLAKQHNGLPVCGWLHKNKLGGLYQAMGSHPSLFKGIKRQAA